MKEVSLTSFIDFVIKSGTPKLTCARGIKDQLDKNYNPAEDYYKRFREGIQEMYKRKLTINQLKNIIGQLPENKVENYSLMINGFRKFIGSKKIKYFSPPRTIWHHKSLSIPINPELGLEWDDKKFIIKLYLKAEKPSKNRIASILTLLKMNLSTKEISVSLLDVRNSKLYIFEESMFELIPLVEGEAESLDSILNNI